VGASIRVMDPQLVAHIAAGEVIERPASVVKELIENALDAHAHRVRVEIQSGGMGLIRVVDDGEGIAPDELPLAFAAHATSKVDSLTALEHVQTLGFRGEALHAIAAVARVEAVSSLHTAEQGARVLLEEGRVVVHEPTPVVNGTRISVFDLFTDVPARRKHLRSERAEAAAIHAVVTHYALSHPAVAFSLQVDGRPTFSSPGTGRLEDAFAATYGAHLLNHMLSIQIDGRVMVSGMVSAPQLTRGNRAAILFSVNGRPVRSAMLTVALEEAYSGLLMVGRHPLAVIHIRLPATEIDPNVHPAKLEVRFVHDREVFAAVQRAVANTLQDLRLTPVVTVGSSLAITTAEERKDHAILTEPLPSIKRGEQGLFKSEQLSISAPSLAVALPALRVVGQSAQTFIIAEGPEGLYMIDQHAAHERVLFDQLIQQRDSALASQPLLEPIALELSARHADALEEYADLLTEFGFDVELFGARSCLVRAVPTAAHGVHPPELVLEILDVLNVDAHGTTFTEPVRRPIEVRAHALTVIACKAAVKAGQTLSLSEMRELVVQLEQTANPHTCPHGRPTMVHISTQQLEREFGRR
jgi:DNA mismatch repair protein MutL